MNTRKYSVCFFLLVLLAFGSQSLPAQKKQSLSTQQQVPLPLPLPCPDIKVNSIYVKLVSTTAGDPHVDIAADKILLSFTAKNVGNVPIPESAQWKTIIKRNDVEILHESYWSAIGVGGVVPPGGIVGLYDIPDTFPHGMRTTYSVQVVTDFTECTTVNNQLSYTIDEAQLHSQKNQDLPTNNQLPPPHVLTCPNLKVVSFKATLVSTQMGDPAVEFPHDKVKLEVKVENLGSPNYPRTTQIHIWINKNDMQIFQTHASSSCGTITESRIDSFPHGVKTTYSVFAGPDWAIPGCSMVSTSASFTIDEGQLHAVQKPLLKSRIH
jgi:hypothetical protein